MLAGCATSLSYVVGVQAELSIRPLYEAMPDYREAVDTYEEHGFAISSVHPVGRDRHLRLADFDCVIVRSLGSG